MKSSNLLIGLGIGVLVGAAIGAFFATSDEDKAEFTDEVNSTVNKAKKRIGKVVNDGLEELDKATERVTQVAKDTISRVKAHQI
ncbi:MAG: YtxH domain-containing protein [Candidatus Symbiothrix sp.]|jgi:gas vesicle protein|nr:YtxH domain-containing protein [Candidatus Symbiothrix sp.]